MINVLQNHRLLDRKSVWLLLAFLSTLPLLFVKTPPLIDVLGHLGRYTVQLNPGDPEIARWYEHHWVIAPNLGVDIIVQVLGQFLSVELAAKLAVMIIPPIFVLSLLWVSKQIHGAVSPWVILALPLVYNYAFIFGFVNYMLSAALAFALFGLAITIKKKWPGKDKNLPFQLVMAALICALCIVHVYGWAIFCILWASHVLANNFESRTNLFSCLAKTFVACIFLLTPIVFITLLSQSSLEGAANSGGWLLISNKFSWIFMSARDRWGEWDIAYIAVILVLIALNFRGSKVRLNSGLTLSVLLMLFFLIVLPFNLMASSYADVRLAPIILITLVLAVGPGSGEGTNRFLNRIFIVGAVVFTARMAGNTISFNLYDREIQTEAAMLDYVPHGSKLISFVKRPCLGKRPWFDNRLNHLPSLALVRKRAFANNQWMAEGAHLLQVKAGLPHDPSHFVFPEHCSEKTLYNQSQMVTPDSFDYLWAIGVDETDRIEKEDGWELIHQVRTSRLYHRQIQ